MNPHRPTAANGVHRTARILLAIATAIALTVVIACSAEEPPPTHRPDKDQQRLEQTIEAVTGQLTALQTETAESQNTSDSDHDRDRQASNAQPTPAKSAQNPQLTTTPTRIVIAPPTGPGICGRSPTIQEAILHTLRTSSCRLVSIQELYRITEFRNLREDPEEPDSSLLMPGDLNGLVNLEHFKFIGDFTISEGILAGAGIRQLSISGARLAPRAFEGMLHIDSLSINDAEKFPVLDAQVLESLTAFGIQFEDPFPNLTGKELGHLTNLRQLRMGGDLYAGMESTEIPQGNDPGRKYRIPTDLLRNTIQLRSVHIDIDGKGRGDYNFTVLVPHDLVGDLNHLESLSISNAHVEGYQPLKEPLALATGSPLADHLTPPKGIPEGWRHSKQYRDLETWTNWTNGNDLTFSR